MEFDDDIEDDLFCQKMYEDYLNNSDPEKHETITIEELAAREGIDLWNRGDIYKMAHVSNGWKFLIRPSSGKDIAETKDVLFKTMIMINVRGIWRKVETNLWSDEQKSHQSLFFTDFPVFQFLLYNIIEIVRIDLTN